MGKSSLKGNDLVSLVARTAALQKASRGFRDDAAESARLALDELVLQILREHLDEVIVRLDPRKSQAWDDFYAVLEVVIDSLILRMPVPKLKSKDSDLAKLVRAKIAPEVKMDGSTLAFVVAIGGIGAACFIVKIAREITDPQDGQKVWAHKGYLMDNGKPLWSIGTAKVHKSIEEAEQFARDSGYEVAERD